MVVFKTFWERQKEKKGSALDVFTYTELPENLRVQIVTISVEVLGSHEEFRDHYGGSGANVRRSYKTIVEILRKEFGVFILPPANIISKTNEQHELFEFILREPDVEKVLSAVELICRVLENVVSRRDYRYDSNSEKSSHEAIVEINSRMKSAGVGYEYDGEIIRIDTELVHEEAVKPALKLLRDKIYSGAEEEFLNAFEHYRKGNTKEALSDALKSIESTMKIICHKRGWAFQPSDTAKKLIDICLTNKLIPPFWQNHFSSLRSMLESSVPTARNKTSGHGQGIDVQTVPAYLASYVLHMTASTIVFLINAERELPA